MPDHAHSDDPAVQAQLNRLTMLSPGRDVLGLERIEALMARLGNPHKKLPPVFHVAGTNGKGSTCAFLRAAIEAAGMKAHVYTSPHLVRFNERIRIAGMLISDADLAPLLSEVLDCSKDIAPSFFEATTAAAFLAFARTPADAAIIEVGLGGRLDATNIIAVPVVCGIASLGLDHEAFLLAAEDNVPAEALPRIAFEKAGIAKAGVPLITMAYPPAMAAAIAAQAARVRTTVLSRKGGWDVAESRGRIHYRDEAGELSLPLPEMQGGHQMENAGLAIAMLRHQSAIAVSDTALRIAMKRAHWPARLQVLGKGPLTVIMPDGSTIWLDGGHNADAGVAIAKALEHGPSVHVIIGMLKNKDVLGFLKPFAHKIASLSAVPVPDHDHHDPKDICWWAQQKLKITDTSPSGNVIMSLKEKTNSEAPSNVLICGSLYLAGEVLRLNEELPV